MTLPLQTYQVTQGTGWAREFQVKDSSGAPIIGVYVPSDTLTGYIYQGDSQVSLASPILTWASAAQSKIIITLASTDTSGLSPGTYRLQGKVSRFGQSPVEVLDALLQITGTPGAIAPPGLPDLVPLSLAQAALTDVGLSAAQVEWLPYAVAGASKSIRRFCGDRDFNRWTYTKEFTPASDGQIRLDQIPVNQILRVQANKRTALTITNTSGSVQFSRVTFSTTGDADVGQVITGLTLTSVSSGVATPTPVLFTDNETISGLATAINALGGGWVAVAEATYADWPVTELVGGLIAQGATQGAGRGNGAVLTVYGDDVTAVGFAENGQQTGLVWVGVSGSWGGGFGPSWGPDWVAWDGGGRTNGTGVVKVTYDAGMSQVPADVQAAAVELSKAILERLRTEAFLQSESAGGYAYTLAGPLLAHFPLPVRQALSLYRIHNA
jgi:hypothetical protein